MASDIQLKRSSVPGRVPDAANVLVGEPVVNLADRILYSKNGSGNIVVIGSNLTVQLVDPTNNATTSVADVRTLQFDSDSGFDVVDQANGIAKVQMNSTFKTWNVQGQANLVATGLDVAEFVAGNNIVITTNANASPQQIRFDTNFSAGQNITIDANGRINSSVTGGGGSGNVFSVNGQDGYVVLTTANVAESGNLYFTNSRARAALTAGDNITIDANGVISSSVAPTTGAFDYGYIFEPFNSAALDYGVI